MSHDADVTSVCEECGASVYREHLQSGIARYEKGKLLCSHCVADYEKAHDAATTGEMEEDFEPIILEGHDEPSESAAGMSSTRITAVSAATLGKAGAWDDSKFERPLRPDITGASRCRTFHCKLSEGAIEFFNGQLNDWLENNDKITIKFATSTIGMFEGKHTEPNMIVNIFY